MTPAESFANEFLAARPDALGIDHGPLLVPRTLGLAMIGTAVAGGLIGWPGGAFVGLVAGGVLYYVAAKTMHGSKAFTDVAFHEALAAELARRPSGLSAQQLIDLRAVAIIGRT